MIAKVGSIDYVSHLVLIQYPVDIVLGLNFFGCIEFLYWFLNTVQFPETAIIWMEKYLQCLCS